MNAINTETCEQEIARVADVNGWYERVEARVQTKRWRRWVKGHLEVRCAFSPSGYCELAVITENNHDKTLARFPRRTAVVEFLITGLPPAIKDADIDRAMDMESDAARDEQADREEGLA